MKQNSNGSSGVAFPLFIGLVSVVGLALVAGSLVSLIREAPTSWLVLAALTAVVSGLGFKLAGPGGKSGSVTSSIGDCFMVAGLLLYGPAAAVVVAAVEAVTVNFGFRIKGRDKWLFNVGQHAVAAFVAGHLFFAVSGLAAPVDWSMISRPWALAAFVVSVAAYSVLNLGLIATAMSLKAGTSFFSWWRKNAIGTGPATLLNATAGLVIVSCSFDFELAAAVILLGLSLYYIGQISLLLGGAGQTRKAVAGLYVATVVAGGLTVSLFSFHEAVLHPSLEWAALLGLTALASLRPSYLPRLRLPEGGMVITFSTVFVFTGLLVAGPAVAVTLSFVEAGISAWKSGAAIRDPKKVVFNLFQLPLAMFLAGRLLYAISPQPLLGNPLFPAAFAVCCLGYLALNVSAVAAAVRLTTGSLPRLVGTEALISAGARQLSEAGLAAVLFICWLNLTPAAAVWVLPAGALLVLSCNSNLSWLRNAQESA